MTTPRRVPLRAGRGPGDAARVCERVPDPGTPIVLLADISEFQPDIADAVYARDFSRAAIIRAMYGGDHDDGAWYGGVRRGDLHNAGIEYLGIYQYVTADQDVTAQAQAFCRLLGELRPGEDVYGAFEEGNGDLWQAWHTWANVIVRELGFGPRNYSGLDFAASHGLAPVDWVAAYDQSEPSLRHMLWQFSDAYDIPGVGRADCSLFHGTIRDLQALAFNGRTQPSPGYALASPVQRPVSTDVVMTWPAGHAQQIYLELGAQYAVLGDRLRELYYELDAIFGPQGGH